MCNNNRRWFRDQRNPEQTISEEQIKREYGEHIADGSIDPAEKAYPQYLHDCMESQGGTLSEILPEEKPLVSYPFMIRETLTMHVDIEAETLGHALEKLEQLYNNGEYDLDHNCFAGAELRPCCSCCGSDFDDDYELREVDDGTPEARVLCDRCVADLEDSGALTRCEACGDLFTPSRLKINPENGLQEICPLCGEVWCE